MGEELTLSGDKNGFMQVIATVLENSLDAIEERQQKDPGLRGEITVQSKAVDEGVRIRICDNGGGIDPKVINRIFEPYFTTRFASHNKGMNLYLARKILEESFAGTIKALNLNGGAAIQIDIPVHV
jgi:signal transduction histidine kinase